MVFTLEVKKEPNPLQSGPHVQFGRKENPGDRVYEIKSSLMTKTLMKHYPEQLVISWYEEDGVWGNWESFLSLKETHPTLFITIHKLMGLEI